MHVGQHDAEAGFFLVLFVERDLDQGGALAEEVHFAGHHFQVDHFDVIDLLRVEVVNVGKLLAFGVYLEVVRVAVPD